MKFTNRRVRRDSILVQTDDATLLAHKSQAQKIKDLVKKLAEDKNQKIEAIFIRNLLAIIS